jgi:hypothetical protein
VQVDISREKCKVSREGECVSRSGSYHGLILFHASEVLFGFGVRLKCMTETFAGQGGVSNSVVLADWST